MNRAVYLAGEPATGKTTLARQVMRNLGEGERFKYGLLRGIHYESGVWVFGIYDGTTFEGTDRLSMAVIDDAIEFLSLISAADSLFLEGDRLLNARFLKALLGAFQCRFFMIKADGAVKAQRHIRRADKQSETFLKSRQTKCLNIEQAFPGNFQSLKNDTKDEGIQNAGRILRAITGLD